jgi:hypothetical protein
MRDPAPWAWTVLNPKIFYAKWSSLGFNLRGKKAGVTGHAVCTLTFSAIYGPCGAKIQSKGEEAVDFPEARLINSHLCYLIVSLMCVL